MFLRTSLLLACFSLLAVSPLRAQTLIKSIAHVKGQEENTLNGYGLVVGLKGTGDGGSMLPAMRSLAAVMESMGAPLGTSGLAELKDAKNVALVMVTAVIPAGGLRQGSAIDCTVSSIGSAKSLAGGVLFSTPLLGPDKNSQEVFAVAEGKLALDDPQLLTTGSIHKGCRMEQDVRHEFLQENRFTIVLDENHADFQLAAEIANAINGDRKIQAEEVEIARAIDQANIIVEIPEVEAGYETEFIGQILEMPVPVVARTAKVVINRRAGSIAISGNVEIGPVVVNHKGIQVDASESLPSDRFAGIDTADDPDKKRRAKLDHLISALQAVRVPTEDLISIIEGIDKNGKLYAQLIIE